MNTHTHRYQTTIYDLVDPSFVFSKERPATHLHGYLLCQLDMHLEKVTLDPNLTQHIKINTIFIADLTEKR